MKTGLESLEVGAPDITYSGNEGPKSPQEDQRMMQEFQMQQMAGGENDRVRELLLLEETQGLSEEEKEELRALIKTISAQMPQGGLGDMPMDMEDRETAAGGGVMGVDGRTGFQGGGKDASEDNFGGDPERDEGDSGATYSLPTQRSPVQQDNPNARPDDSGSRYQNYVTGVATGRINPATTTPPDKTEREEKFIQDQKNILEKIADANNKAQRIRFMQGVDKFVMPRARDFYMGSKKSYDPNDLIDEDSDEYEFLVNSGYFAKPGGPRDEGDSISFMGREKLPYIPGLELEKPEIPNTPEEFVNRFAAGVSPFSDYQGGVEVDPMQFLASGGIAGLRQPAAFGGIMGDDGRRAYGLGSIFKKISKPFKKVAKAVKKVAKSPLGKAALLYLGGTYLGGLQGLGGSGIGAGQNFGFKGFGGRLMSPFSSGEGIGNLANMFKANAPGTFKLPGFGGAEKLNSTDSLLKNTKKIMDNPLFEGSYSDALKLAGNTAGKTAGKFGLKEALLIGLPSIAGGIYTAKQPQESLDQKMANANRGPSMKDVFGMDLNQISTGARAGTLDPNRFNFMGNADTRILSADGGRIDYANGGIGKLRGALSKETFNLGEEDDEDNIIKLAFGGSAGMPPVTMMSEGQNIQSFGDDESTGMAQGPQNPMPMPMPMQRPMMDPRMMQMMMAQQGGQNRMMAAMGGRMGYAEGGESELLDMGGLEKDYRNDGGFVPMGEYERKDDVPARLSKNEFVFTADAVRNAGGGDIDKGAEIMENMMTNLENGGKVSQGSQGLSGAREMFQTQQRLGEVL